MLSIKWAVSAVVRVEWERRRQVETLDILLSSPIIRDPGIPSLLDTDPMPVTAEPA